jgi:hypothetical protein
MPHNQQLAPTAVDDHHITLLKHRRKNQNQNQNQNQKKKKKRRETGSK